MSALRQHSIAVWLLSGTVHSLAVVLVLRGLGNGSSQHLRSKFGNFSQSHEHAASSACPSCPTRENGASRGYPSASGELAPVWPALSFNEEDDSNPLSRIFQGYTEGLIVDKWLPYISVYHRYFSAFRGKPVRFLEIGVQSGGTIQLWKQYFGQDLDYHGVDINFLCKELFGGAANVSITLGDQANATFWSEFLAGQAPFDIVVDDGGHSMQQQITTFEAVYPHHVAKGGIYLVEDMATSYDRPWTAEDSVDAGTNVPNTEEWGGGYGKPTTWAEFAKAQVDHLNGHYIARDGFPSDVTKNTLGISFFDQMVVFERGDHPRARTKKRGTVELPYTGNPKDFGEAELSRLRKVAELYL